MPTLTSPRRSYRFEGFVLDPQAGELRKQGTKLKIQGMPLELLAILLENPKRVVTRDELQKRLWPPDTFVDFEHGLNSAMQRLREALNDSAEQPRFVETLARRGYRFIRDVECIEDESRLPPVEDRGSGNILAGRRGRRLAATTLAVLALLGVAYLMTAGRNLRNPVQPKITSLAVLPLKNLSGDATQEYLADGMTEALIGRLSQIHNLRVISRTSVMRFKEAQLSVPEIARTLHVDAIVEGSVIREGSRIRVTSQLIRGATDEHLWSEAYDRELREVLALESEVAQAVAGKIAVVVTGEEKERLAAARPVSPEVYESYLKGRYALDKANDQASVRESIAYFEEAQRKDPTFAPAYAGEANAYYWLSSVFMGGANPGDTRPKVVGEARKALERDPENAEAHMLLAEVLRNQWRWAEAEAEYKRSLQLNANNAAAYGGYAHWLLAHGRAEEALAWAERGRERDPNPDGISSTDVGWILFEARRYEEALAEFRGLLAVRPNDAEVPWFMGFVLIAKGQPEEAIPVLEKAVSASNRSAGAIGVLIRAYAHAGRRKDALRLLEELKSRKQKNYVPAGAFVHAYLGLDENEQAFVWLEQAYKEQSSLLQALKVHPYFDPIRNDPRFADLLRRVGLE